MELFRTIINCNNRNDAPFYNEKIWYEIQRVIAEEEADANNITLDAHNVTVYTFSHTSNTQREKEKKILISEKLDKLDALEETLKGLTINDAGYYETESTKSNDGKEDPASDM